MRDATATEFDAATAAFPAWAGLPGHRRKATLHKVAELIEARADQIAEVPAGSGGSVPVPGL